MSGPGAPSSALAAVVDWLSDHDPGLVGLRRGLRAAVVLPPLLAFGDRVLDNPTFSFFVAFGTIATLLLVDFTGSISDRIRAQTLMVVACAVLICLGTLASRSTLLAVAGMLVVGFVVLFSCVVSSVIAGSTTALLLAFILPVTVPAPPSEIPIRIAGWGLAGGVSVVAITLLWPAPTVDPLRTRAVAAIRALAARLRSEVRWLRGDGGQASEAEYLAACGAAEQAVRALQRLFFATPYRPTGLSTEARAELRLFDELRWLSGLVLRSAPPARPPSVNPHICAVKLAGAEVLDQSALALDDPRLGLEPLAAASDQLEAALRELERHTTLSSPVGAGAARVDASAIAVDALDPSFRAQELSYVTRQIAVNVSVAVAAARRGWWERLTGRQPAGFTGALVSARERALTHAQPSSSSLHNSLRGAAALALAVLVADLTSLQHGFWVVFGTLAVLRSNALSTGESVMRALVGTAAGFAIGGALVALIGTNTTLLWVLLPIVVLFAGLAPAAISFAAGQAAFTVTLLVLFNLLVPVGWKLGLVRVVDVAVGGAVSLVVGLLFWPRGAGPALGRALAEAYRDSTEYLAEAIAYGVGRCDRGAAPVAPPQSRQLEAAAAARRLDDTFRGYLAERGAKRVPLADVTKLVTGVAGVRLAADAVVDLWDADSADGADRAAARQELLSAAEQMTDWYRRFADSLASGSAVPAPIDGGAVVDGRIAQAVVDDLLDPEGRATDTGIRVIWTGDHLDAVRRLQQTLVEPARVALVQPAEQ